jgi:hypothetical protein
MNRAIVVLILAICSWLAANLWFRPGTSDPVSLFMDEVGESWFGAYLGDEKVGYARFVASRDGDFQVASQLTLRLPAGTWYHVEERKRFDAASPHVLREFQREERSNGSVKQLLIERDVTGAYRATVVQGDDVRHLPMALEYGLVDQVGVRGWLQSDPPVGSTRALRDIDIERLQPLYTRWKLVASGEDYVLEGVGEGVDRRTVLDSKHRLVELEIGGGLRLMREPETTATLLNPVVETTGSGPRLDRAIGNARFVQQLVLGLNEPAAEAFDDAPGQKLMRESRGARLTLDPRVFANAANRPEQFLAETVAYPRTPAITELAMRAVADAPSDRQRAMRLTRFVHEFLTYRDATSALSVGEIVETRLGDCTEHAALFTTLARAVGLPARTVSGLVYRDEKGDGLVLHAWNEVVIDGHWHAVDPTWNEFDIDAAHLRFPLEPDRLIRAHALLPEMRFEVLEVQTR